MSLTSATSFEPSKSLRTLRVKERGIRPTSPSKECQRICGHLYSSTPFLYTDWGESPQTWMGFLHLAWKCMVYPELMQEPGHTGAKAWVWSQTHLALRPVIPLPGWPWASCWNSLNLGIFVCQVEKWYIPGLSCVHLLQRPHHHGPLVRVHAFKQNQRIVSILQRYFLTTVFMIKTNA